MSSTATPTAPAGTTEKIAPSGGTKYTQSGAELDDSLYELTSEEEQFLIRETGISDPEELKKHVLDIQREVYAVHPYPCIKIFHFVKLKTCTYPIYPQVVELARLRPGALYLDIGCCVGNDIRKVVADGWPVTQVIGSDLQADFWPAGHKVFKSTPESFPAKFIPGDVFDTSFLEPAPPATEVPQNPVDLSSLTTLTPLRGRISAIQASSLFHLFNEEQQTALAHLLASLLSPEPGSFICGGHVGRPEKGFIPEPLVRANTSGVRMFCHCPESFDAIWISIFGPGRVEVGSSLIPVERKDIKGAREKGAQQYWLRWWVKRL